MLSTTLSHEGVADAQMVQSWAAMPTMTVAPVMPMVNVAPISQPLPQSLLNVDMIDAAAHLSAVQAVQATFANRANIYALAMQATFAKHAKNAFEAAQEEMVNYLVEASALDQDILGICVDALVNRSQTSPVFGTMLAGHVGQTFAANEDGPPSLCSMPPNETLESSLCQYNAAESNPSDDASEVDQLALLRNLLGERKVEPESDNLPNVQEIEARLLLALQREDNDNNRGQDKSDETQEEEICEELQPDGPCAKITSTDAANRALKLIANTKPRQQECLPNLLQRNVTQCATHEFHASDSMKIVEQKTTVIIRRLPKKCSYEKIVLSLHKRGFKGKFDFVYMPCDFQTRHCKGYAIVNCRSEDGADRMQDCYHQQKVDAYELGEADSEMLDVVLADHQGFIKNAAQHLTRRRSRRRDPSHLPLVFLEGDHKGQRLTMDILPEELKSEFEAMAEVSERSL